MSGYKRERDYIFNKYGYRVDTCEIAHVKSDLGLTRGIAPNRIDPNKRQKRCRERMRGAVEDAVRHFRG